MKANWMMRKHKVRFGSLLLVFVSAARTLCLLTSALLFSTTPATAQGVFDIGILTNTLTIPADSNDTQDERSKSLTANPANPASLRYVASQAIRKSMESQMLASVPYGKKGDPLYAFFANAKPIDTMQRQMELLALTPLDIADTQTMYLASFWAFAQGRNEFPTRSQVGGLKKQLVPMLLKTPNLAVLSNSEKQKFVEELLIQTWILSTLMQAVKDDPAATAQLSAKAAQALKTRGLDPDAIDLTASGFVARN